jgi:SAM-dependent methyltransferase
VIAARAPEPQSEAPDGLPIPPARLRVLVDGHGDPDGFLRDSRAGADVIRYALADAGRSLSGSVLDFGCGCGRTTRNWAALGLDLHGCDYNPRLVEWCRENLPFMEATVNGLEPPAPYEHSTFDVVYAISILTHLTEELAARWVSEWRRILRPGGVLVVTTIGDSYREQLSAAGRERYDAGEAVVKAPRVEGLNACVAHHPQSYVVDELLADFDVLAFVPGGTVPSFQQDAYVAT